MKAINSGKVERLHLFIQIFTQVTTVIVAIVVGFWGYYSTIYVKKEKEVTEYTLKELEQRTTQTPHIQAKFRTNVQPLDNGLRMLQIKVMLSNLGNKESRVSLDDDSLTLIPVEFSKGNPIFKTPVNLLAGRYSGTLNRMPLNFVDIGPGENYELTFVHSLNSSGVFLIHFLALNGIKPSENKFSSTESIPFKYSVGMDDYIIIK